MARGQETALLCISLQTTASADAQAKLLLAVVQRDRMPDLKQLCWLWEREELPWGGGQRLPTAPAGFAEAKLPAQAQSGQHLGCPLQGESFLLSILQEEEDFEQPTSRKEILKYFNYSIILWPSHQVTAPGTCSGPAHSSGHPPTARGNAGVPAALLRQAPPHPSAALQWGEPPEQWQGVTGGCQLSHQPGKHFLKQICSLQDSPW